MQQKTLFIIIGLILVLGVVTLAVFMLKPEKKPERISTGNDLTELASVDQAGQVSIINRQIGAVIVNPTSKNQVEKIYESPVYTTADKVTISPDKKLALATTRDSTGLNPKYSLVDLQTGGLIRELGSNWHQPIWDNNSQIVYAKFIDDEYTDGVYAYSPSANTTTKIYAVDGDIEDSFEKIGQYLIYANSGTDVAPVTVQVYDTLNKKVVQSLELDDYTQLLADNQRAVVIGKTIVEIVIAGNEIQINEYPRFLDSAIYALADNRLLAAEVTLDKIELATGVLLLASGGDWRTLNIVLDLDELGYIYEIAGSGSSLTVIAKSGVYNYEY